jgi:hypothetical protein
MKTYIEYSAEGVIQSYSDPDGRSIPPASGNTDYANMMQEVADGLAEIIEVDDTPVPTVDELRIAAYGSIGDQLDEIYHDVDAWRARIAGVKAANPRGA